MKPIRIGRLQQEIVQHLRAGATLYKEDKFWYLAHPEWRKTRRVVGESCSGLVLRGIIRNSGTEEHPTYRGGYRTKYTLTKVAEEVKA
jgi:hypothetical protein